MVDEPFSEKSSQVIQFKKFVSFDIWWLAYLGPKIESLGFQDLGIIICLVHLMDFFSHQQNDYTIKHHCWLDMF